MKPMRRRGDLPKPEEVLAFQLYSAAHGMKLHPGLFNIEWQNEDGLFSFEITEVIDHSAELHPSVTVKVRLASAGGLPGRNTAGGEQADASKDEPDSEEHGEGTVRNQRQD